MTNHQGLEIRGQMLEPRPETKESGPGTQYLISGINHLGPVIVNNNVLKEAGRCSATKNNLTNSGARQNTKLNMKLW